MSSLIAERDNITIVGTTHMSRQSVHRVRNIISDEEPHIVAVELGPRRYNGPSQKQLRYNEDSSTTLRTSLFLPLIQHIQSKSPENDDGFDRTDMEVAVEEAVNNEAEIALLDRDILHTFDKLWKEAGILESIRFVSAIGLALIGRNTHILNPETDSIQNGVIEYRKKTKQKYPKFRQVFLDERDKMMAEKLHKINNQRQGKIVVVVGAAHVPGILERLDKSSPEVDLNLPIINTKSEGHR